MVTIVAGSPGNHEVTPATTANDLKDDRCIGSVKHPTFNEPLAACRANYGYGYVQGAHPTTFDQHALVRLDTLNALLVLYADARSLSMTPP